LKGGLLTAGLGLFVPGAAGVEDAAGEVTYVEISLEPEGELLGSHFVDVDVDGREEVVLAVLSPAGSRELQLFRIGARGVSPEPYRVVPVLADAIAYGFADVRAEAGRELFFLTRGGAWSLSLEREGFRGNVARLAEMELVYDVSDPEDLQVWEYVLTGEGGDRVLLPGRNGYTVWGPGNGADGDATTYVPLVEIEPPAEARERSDDRRGRQGRRDREEVTFGPGGMRLSRTTAAELPPPFIEEASGDTRVFLSSASTYRAPALLDVDGDGTLDLVTLGGAGLAVRLGGVGAAPDRVEPLPDYLPPEDLVLEFVDLDGDGDPDLIARVQEEEEELGNTEKTLFLLLNDGARLLPREPDQVLRFEAAELRVEVADIDGDGRPDLGLRKFEMPSLLGTVTGVEFTLTYLLYTGTGGPGGTGGRRPVERKPTLKQERKFDETTIQDAIKNRVWRLDCDGDGLADLVEIDLEGRITIRRLVHSSSFFGGDSWSLEETPWQRFETFGNIDEVEVRDLNGDGLGDVVSEGYEALTILLSARRGGGR
jgi:hypothetical protein